MFEDAATKQPSGETVGQTLQRYLKEATRPLHARTEKAFDLKRRIATLDGYRDGLVGLYRLHAAAGQALNNLDWRGVQVDLAPSRQRLDWLRADLSYYLFNVADLAPAPLLSLEDEAEGLGCLYVIEGSMLGGEFISRAIHQRLGVTKDTGGRFFAGFGTGTDAAWTAFVVGLDRHPVARFGLRAATGARKTFNLFAVVGTNGSGADQGVAGEMCIADSAVFAG
jgi:heme oxygenase